ncbi:hypothetical protein [Fulvivirga sp.]|uniref:hypothetical protein n=1 Tax=Fulvivirga sp. TaxID=1931237 RepID=UPI0032EE887F
MGVSNIIGISSIDSPDEHNYFIYAIKENINEATLIACLGVIFVVIGYELNVRNYNYSYRTSLWKFPSSNSHGNSSIFFFYGSCIVIISRVFNTLPQFIGAFEALIFMLPPAGIFYLSRLSVITSKNKYLRLALILLVMESTRALMFDYLRTHFIVPGLAYFLGYVYAKPKMNKLFTIKLLPVYGVFMLFIVYFTVFGESRSTLGQGSDRISQLQEIDNEMVDKENTLFMRFSNFNQLTNVVEVVKLDGFYYGETLNYLAFAFIPRIIWPEKPLIQMGAWFAQKIGRGYVDEEGRARNAINMTPAGELYMNFGITGVIFGSIIIGYIISIFWSSVNITEAPHNISGNLFGFYLFFLGLFSFGANLSILVTVTAMYIASHVLALLLKLFVK